MKREAGIRDSLISGSLFICGKTFVNETYERMPLLGTYARTVTIGG